MVFLIALFTVRSIMVCGHIHQMIISKITIIIPFLSMQRSSQWSNEEVLFVSGYSVCPHNAKVKCLPSSAYSRWTSFMHCQVLYNIGKVRTDAGDTVMGEVAYREAIR